MSPSHIDVYTNDESAEMYSTVLPVDSSIAPTAYTPAICDDQL
jgi:hypothetical protein